LPLGFKGFRCTFLKSLRFILSMLLCKTDYRQDDGFRSPAEAKNFSSSLCVQTSSETHPDSCPLGTGFLSPGGGGGKVRSGSEPDRSSPSSAEVKKG
jgi:hypothetical protein